MSMCSSMSEACEDTALHKRIVKEEIAKCIRKLQNRKTSGSDGLVGELGEESRSTYGGSGMVYLLEYLFGKVWQEEVVPKEERGGSLLKKDDRRSLVITEALCFSY